MSKAPSKKQQTKRTKSVVNPKVQWTLAARVILHFAMFIIAGFAFGLINQFLADPFGGLAKNTSRFLRSSAPLLLALACLIPVFIRDTLTLTNRIAGPIFNLQRHMGRIAKGEEVGPLKFRKHDMWDGLPETFNEMVTELNRKNSNSSPSTVAQKEEPVGV